MTNKYRLKIFYNDKKITLDVDENVSFLALKKKIDECLNIKASQFAFLEGTKMIAGSDLDNAKSNQIKDYFELDQELRYIATSSKKKYEIKIIVWDYLLEGNKEIIKKFMQMAKQLDNLRPKQKYYLPATKQNFIDKALYDCYCVLKGLDFNGIYNYILLKNNENYWVVKVVYYLLDDKYEISFYQSVAAKEKNDYEYLITFYHTNRAYFKGYQGRHRNIFVLHRDDTLKADDFEEFYLGLNRVTYMLSTIDQNKLFINHDDYLKYDFVTDQVIENTIK